MRNTDKTKKPRNTWAAAAAAMLVRQRNQAGFFKTASPALNDAANNLDHEKLVILLTAATKEAVNHRNRKGRSAWDICLHHINQTENNAEALKQFLQFETLFKTHGAEMQYKVGTPLHWHARYLNYEALKECLNNPQIIAHINTQDENGNTAAHLCLLAINKIEDPYKLADEYDKYSALFAEHKMDLDIKNNEGQSVTGLLDEAYNKKPYYVQRLQPTNCAVM